MAGTRTNKPPAHHASASAAQITTAEEKYRTFFANAEIGMFRSRIDGSGFLDINNKFLSMLGRTREEVIGKHTAKIWASPRERAESVAALRINNYDTCECRFRRKDGSIIICMSSTRIYPEEGILEGAVFDITERKHSEKLRLHFAQELIRVREEEKKALSASLHHDIGSLMVGMSARHDAIEADLLAGKNKDALQWLKQARALFTDSLLRFRQIAIDIRPPELDIIGLRAALRQHIAKTSQATGVRIQLAFTLGKDVLRSSQSTILFRITQEAITNAIRHGHATQIDLLLKNTGRHIQLIIRDNGKCPVQASATRPTASSGMGVMMMQEMVKADASNPDEAEAPRFACACQSRPQRPTVCPYKPITHLSSTREHHMPIRVFIADDHPVVRLGLRMTIERSGEPIEVVGEAANGAAVLRTLKTNPADVYILDITMPEMNGIDTARELLRKSKSAKVLILSLHDTKTMVQEAIASGAHGYLTKEMATKHIVEAITELSAGRRYICPMIAHFIVEADMTDSGSRQLRKALFGVLTGQEKKVLQRIAEGQSNKEIAEHLKLSINTVRVHRTNLMRKLDIHKQADLVRYAIKAGSAKL